MPRHAKQQGAYWEEAYGSGRNEQISYEQAYGRQAYGNQQYAQQAPSDWGYPASSNNVNAYSRDKYESWSDFSNQNYKPRGRRAKKILIAILAIIVVFVACVGAYVFMFNSKIQGNFSSTPEGMSEVLTPAQAGEPYYILLLGSDWRENSGTSDLWENSYDNQRADVIILARMDPANKQVTLVSVPRDTRWNYEGKTYKINEAYNIGGAALETKAISELTGVNIAHTVETHFSGLENLVDALGGVWIDVPQTIEYKDALTGEQVTVEAGRQLLTGQQAQIFARVRKAYSGQNASGQDATRQGNVRTLVLAIADTIREKPFFEYPGLGLAIADCLGSDMNLGDFAQLALAFGGGGLTLYSGTGPAAGEIDEANDGLWLCCENPEGWKAVMDVVDAGGDPSDIDADSYLVSTPAIEEGYYDEYGNYIDPNAGYTDYGYYDEGYYEE